MASQLRAVLPCMSEPINFKFLWREDHLSDYTLVICSEPEPEQPLAEAEQQANELARQYRPSLTRYIQVKKDTSAQRAHQYAANRRTPAIALTGSNIPAPCADRPVFIDPWKTTYASKSATIQGPKTSSSAAAAALQLPPGKQQRKRCLTAPPEASASRSRRNATSATAAASAAAEDASAATPAGPTTRSAKRRKQGGSSTQRRIETAVLPPAAAAAAAQGGGAGPDTTNSNTNPLVDLVVELASTSDSDNVDWTMDKPNAPGLRQSHCRSNRDMLSTPAATAASASQGADANLLRGLSPSAGPSGTPAPPAAAAAAAAGATCSSQQQQQQSAGEVLEAAGGTSMPASPAAAAAGPSQPALIVHRELPVHGAVLSAMSEYFRALIQNWQGSEKRLMMEVQEDEATAAEALVEFMYTGELPAVSHDDMLKLMRLSDRFQVKNCPAACAHRFSSTPMEDLSLETVCAIFDWPDFLKDAEPFKGVFSKAWSKLLELFGDLEVAWQDITRRQQFVDLPHQVMKRLLGSDAVAVFCENTILVALAEWMHYQRSQQNTEFNLGLTCSQQREVAEMVRLQHLSPTFLGSVLKRLPLMSPVLTPEALQAAARYATANEATRNKLHSLTIKQHRMKVLYAPPRARSAMQRLEFTWVLELQTVKAMIEQFRNTKVTVDRYSEPHYFNGFQWQLVLQVLEPPAKQPAAGLAAAAAAVDVFVGTTARIQIGGVQYMPDVLYFRGQLAAREVASGDYTFVNRMESGFVCGTAGWGFRNFLRITDWDNEAALRRFFYDGKLHLRCNIDHCE